MSATLLASVDNLALYAIEVLRSHGMCVDALKDIYRAVVLAKLLYASPAWWGFATTTDKQRIEALSDEAFGSAFFLCIFVY